ncbi:MAG: hypothetical protein ABI396_02630 [Ktedonobacteraceae bacterium]
MPAPSKEEITQKLADLKAYSREFDRYHACMRSTSGEQANEAYRAMLEAEKHYIALSDWFINQHLHILWDRERQEYLLPSIQVEVRLQDRHHPTSDTSDTTATTATTATTDTISNTKQRKTPHEKVEPQVSVEEHLRP